MPYSEVEFGELSRRIGKSRATLFRWSKQVCDLRSHASVQAWIEKNKLRETNVTKSRRRRGIPEQGRSAPTLEPSFDAFQPSVNGDLGPPGRRGAAAALERLERQEEEAHRRLVKALERGDPLEIDSTQNFWLKISEVSRRLDLAIELSRRTEEQQIPLRKAQDAVLFVAEWLRISVTIFLSSETIPLMAIKDPAEFRAYFG